MLRTATKLFRNANFNSISVRSMTHYPIDDAFFGLTEDQSAVSSLKFKIYVLISDLIKIAKLRQTVFNFAQKELAPFAQEIDKNNEFKELRSFWKKLGSMGLLGITAKPEYGGNLHIMSIIIHYLIVLQKYKQEPAEVI